jgi:dethiobiotin synthetase
MTARRVFITGTDTGVGKTHVARWLIRQLQESGLLVGAYKPVCSGAIPGASGPVWEDVDQLSAGIGDTFPSAQVGPQRFLAPLAPPVAAALESREVDERLLLEGADWWNERVDVLLIEGAGGWLSPVSRNWTNADLASQLNADVILVAANRLGVVNHALLSIDHIRRTNRLLGVLLNQACPQSPDDALPAEFDPAESNQSEIERLSGVELWGTLSHG